jgi:hypothetical protein
MRCRHQYTDGSRDEVVRSVKGQTREDRMRNKYSILEVIKMAVSLMQHFL